MSESASFLGDGTHRMTVNACERRVTSFSDSMDIEGFCCLTAFVDDNDKEKAHVFFMTDNGLAYFTNLERGTGNPVRAVAEE